VFAKAFNVILYRPRWIQSTPSLPFL